MPATYSPLKVKVDPDRQRIIYPSPLVAFATITPAIAEAALVYNLNPRTIRQSALEQRKADLLDGNWSMETGSILFDRYGWLRDGQHRLTAVVATGIPIVANVVLGASEPAVASTDTGSRRSWSDQLKGRGVPNTIAIQSGVTLSWKWDHDLNGLGANTSPTVPQLEAWFAEHPLSVEYGIEAMRWKRALKGGKPGVFFAFISRMNDIDSIAAREWGDAMESGANLGELDPIKRVRDRIMTSAHRPNAVGDRIIELGVIVKAWNLWVMGRQTKFLSWRRGANAREPFPQMLNLDGDVHPFPDVTGILTGRGLAAGNGRLASTNGAGRDKATVKVGGST
jgi:hypothetical protein